MTRLGSASKNVAAEGGALLDPHGHDAQRRILPQRPHRLLDIRFVVRPYEDSGLAVADIRGISLAHIADDQRVDNCKVTVDLRGPKPRPDRCREAKPGY